MLLKAKDLGRTVRLVVEVLKASKDKRQGAILVELGYLTPKDSSGSQVPGEGDHNTACFS